MSQNGKKPSPHIAQEINGKMFAVENLRKASNHTALVASIAERFLLHFSKVLPEKPAAKQLLFAKAFADADQWVNMMKQFEYNELNRLQDMMDKAMPMGHDGKRIVIADAGTMKDWVPPGSIPNL